MVSVKRFPSVETSSRLLGALAVLSAVLASIYLLLPDPLTDVFFSGIVLLSVLFALVGEVGAWTNRTPLVWVAALLLTGLAIAGMMSIGFVIAPAALFMLGAALLSQLAGPRRDVREAIIADPPTVREAVLRTVAGTASVAVGAGLVYAGAFARELFGSCASETLACVLDTTHWDAVGITLLGLAAVGLGGWFVWRQIYVARVLGGTRTDRL